MMRSQLLADGDRLPLRLYLNQEIVSKFVLSMESKFSNQGKATRTMGEILEAMWSHPWKSWKDFSKEDENRMFERFKRKNKDVLSRARESAKATASNACVEVGDDLSVIIPYKPRWMGAQIWETLIQYWNTKEWKYKSTQNKSNRGKSTGGKHTLGSQTYATLKQKMDKQLGRVATVDEVWMQSHGKKGTRPLDILLSCRGCEDSQTSDGLDEIDLSSTVKWVDTRVENSLKSYKKYVKDKYGDGASKRPLFDEDSWIQAGGGKKKGRIYGFNDINDPHLLMTGTPSTPGTTSRNEEVCVFYFSRAFHLFICYIIGYNGY
ncbi:putative transposase, Ptta/En/Spm, plant [Helianthus anomalus]